MGLALLALPGLSPANRLARAAVMGVAAAALVRYLAWRLASTLPPLSLAPAAVWMWALAVFEAMALGNAILTALFLTRRGDRRSEADHHEARLRTQAVLPAVDVVIPTYSEPLEVIERTVVGALALDWPEVRVWVLDDGERAWLRDWCAARGVRWTARNQRGGGKAGNLNAWLAASRDQAAPYMMVLDADFVPQCRFLWRVMGFFADEAVALVQTPQSFFNPDPIQMNLLCGQALADEQRFFYHDFQPSLDAWGAAFCCGTSFVVRRDRLDAVGGIPTDTVTEDMMTTYALARAGGRTVYLDEPLSAGLAPETLSDFIGQRARWCLGTVQALRSPLSPLKPGIGWAARLCFVNAQLYWLASFPLMLMAVLAPAVYWWTGVPAFLATPGDFVAHFGPRFVAEAAAMLWISKGAVVPLLGGLAPLVTAPAVVAAAVKALARPRGHAFKVTRKGGGTRGVVVHGRLMVWIGAVLAAVAAGMALSPAVAEPSGLDQAWSVYAGLMLFLGLLVCVEVPRRRGHERLTFAEPAVLEWPGGRADAVLDEMSLTGAGLAVAHGPAAGACTLVVAGVGARAATVVRRAGGRLSVRFDDPGERRDLLLCKLYTTPAVLPGAGLDPPAAIRAAFRRAVLSAD
ncbi:MAG: glycosyltransferase [Actinomycetota bacterium]